MSFTHLQVTSGYSFFKSTIKIEKLINHAKSLELTSLVLADENTMHGVVEFYEQCLAANIKPIIGLTVNFQMNEAKNGLPLVFLAKSFQGYQNLMALSTAVQKGEVVDSALLKVYKNDLICIQTSSDNLTKQAIFRGQFDEINAIITSLKDIFDKDNFYYGVEIYTPLEKNRMLEYVKALTQIHEGLNFVALQSIRYLNHKDYRAFTCFQAMGAGEKWSSENISQDMVGHHFKTYKETTDLYDLQPDLIKTIEDIIEACHLEIPLKQKLLPQFPIDDGKSSQAYLRALTVEALEKKYNQTLKDAKERLNYELSVIEKFNFADYFLIVSDIVNYAKENNIRVGPGRGSAAGSIVAYLLGITTVDPLEHDLLFERFLNPGRVSLPDIDLDILDTRRDEVIQYIQNKYGIDYVAQIVTFGTFQARSLMRELMKTMEVSESDQTYILRQLPQNASAGLLEMIQPQEELKTYIKQSQLIKQLFSIAFLLEGLPRHASTHAAGVIIGQDKLMQYTPLMPGSNDIYLTQYPMGELEHIGLLKIDLLGLRNLTLIDRIIKDVERTNQIKIDDEKIPEDDLATFQLLKKGQTNGIFQLESDGMKETLKSLQPTDFNDIVAVNALYRPGPMAQIPHFIKRKHGAEKIAYIHPDLESILQDTYGIIVYQEQIMQIAHQFAGLTLGESDLFRRAISKKDMTLIEQEKRAFIQGCLDKGYGEGIANQVFNLIYEFANYGFNKSHAVAYSKISYRLTYLKAHYPRVFYAQFLSHVHGQQDKFAEYVKEAALNGIKLLPPSINESYAYFSVEGDHIRFGLSAIKGIGYDTAIQIIKARKNGKYKSLYDFVIRTDVKRVNIELLILSGAFDTVYANRASLLASLDRAFETKELFGDTYKDDEITSQTDRIKVDYQEMEDFSVFDKLKEEKELLQIYLTEHPLKKYRKQLTLEKIPSLKEIKSMQLKWREKVKTIAFVERFEERKTKQNQPIVFMDLTDEADSMKSVIFASALREINTKPHENMLVQVTAEKNYRQGQPQLIIQDLEEITLETLDKMEEKVLFIKLEREKVKEEALGFIEKLAKRQPGKTKIILHDTEKSTNYKLAEKYNIYYDSNIMLELKEYFGNGNVVYTV